VNTLIQGTVNTLKTYAGTSAGAPRQQVWLNEFARPTTLAARSGPAAPLPLPVAR
jgi:hypothetical protein